jgi:hypothetical protein
VNQPQGLDRHRVAGRVVGRASGRVPGIEVTAVLNCTILDLLNGFRNSSSIKQMAVDNLVESETIWQALAINSRAKFGDLWSCWNSS